MCIVRIPHLPRANDAVCAYHHKEHRNAYINIKTHRDPSSYLTPSFALVYCNPLTLIENGLELAMFLKITRTFWPTSARRTGPRMPVCAHCCLCAYAYVNMRLFYDDVHILYLIQREVQGLRMPVYAHYHLCVYLYVCDLLPTKTSALWPTLRRRAGSRAPVCAPLSLVCVLRKAFAVHRMIQTWRHEKLSVNY
jgi:hypothetical protein